MRPKMCLSVEPRAAPTPDPGSTEAVAARVRSAIGSGDLAAVGELLDPAVRWGGPEDTPETCHGKREVLDRLSALITSGAEVQVIECVPGAQSVLLGLRVRRPAANGYSRERTVHQVLTVRDGLIAEIRAYPDRGAAAAQAGLGERARSLEARQVVPILNVSDLSESSEWFEKLGWTKKWAWCDTDGTPTFAAISSGGLELFLSLNSQGGRGVWLSIWVADVDAVHAVCVREDVDVIRPPQDEPWGVREMHVRHPDGHVFRISQPIHAH